jgi:hypothetical protein
MKCYDKKNNSRLGMVVHTCSPSFLGGDQENQALRLAWAKS